MTDTSKFLMDLFGTGEPDPKDNVLGKWLEKSAEDKKAVKQEKTAATGISKEELEKMNIEDIIALVKPEEKVAEGDITEEQAIDILKNVSAQQLLDAQKQIEKQAAEEVDLTKISALDYLTALGEQEMDKTAGEELDLNTISATDFIAGVQRGEIVLEDQEKVAEESGEIDLNQITAAQLMAGLESGEIELLEKDAEEEKTRQQLIDLIEKQAGGYIPKNLDKLVLGGNVSALKRGGIGGVAKRVAETARKTKNKAKAHYWITKAKHPGLGKKILGGAALTGVGGAGGYAAGRKSK